MNHHPDEEKQPRLQIKTLARDYGSKRFLPHSAMWALFASFCSCFLSLGLLKSLDGANAWPSDGIYSFVQPASILAVLLAIVGIFVRYALEEGSALVFWKYYYKGANAATLQRIWEIRDFAPNAFRSGFEAQHRRYIIFPFLFIMLFPLNSFILQGALVTVRDFAHETVNIQVPSVPFLDFGFSWGTDDPDSGWGGLFGNVWQQVMNPGASTSNRYAFVGSNFYYNYTTGTNTTFDLKYDNESIYTAFVPGAGFAHECSTPELRYDLWPTTEVPVKEGYLLWTNISFSADTPNNIYLDAYWKTDYACSGFYQTTRCILRAATVEYPIEIRMNISDSPYLGPFFSLQRSGSATANDKVLEILPVDSREGSGNPTRGMYTYAGIRHALAHSYNSTYYVRSRLNEEIQNSDFIATGQFLDGFIPSVAQYYGVSAKPCNFTFLTTSSLVDYYRYLDSNIWNQDVANANLPSTTNQSASPATVILDRLRQAMFLTSIYRGSYALAPGKAMSTLQSWPDDFPREHFIQTVQADRQYAVVRYRIRLANWGASLAITWVAILLVLPAFWGFWSLPCKKGVSPLEIAQAFKAPLLRGISDDARPNEMIERIGDESPYQDDVSPTGSIDPGFIVVRNGNRDAKVVNGSIYWL